VRRFRLWLIFLAAGSIGWGSPSEEIYVNRVTILGAHAIAEDHIRSLLRLKPGTFFSRTKFDRRVLKLDALTVKTLYLSRGFLEVTVKDSFTVEDKKADVYLVIHEGKQYFLKGVKVTGNRSVNDKVIYNLLELKPGKPYNPVTINANLTLLEEAYQRKGKLFCSIQVNDAIRDSVDLFINIREGPDVYIHTYFIEGLEGLDTLLVTREFAFRVGERYDLDKITLTQKRLMETGVFSFANITPLKIADSDTMVNLLVELRRFKPREWISEGGYYPIEFYEGVEPFPGIGGEVEWRSRTLFRTMTNFSTKLTGHIPLEQEIIYPRVRFDVGFANQWFLGFRIPTRIKLYYETFRNYGQTGNPKILRYGLRLTNLYRFQERSFLESGLQWEKFIEPAGQKQDIEQRSYNLQFHWDAVDDPLYPNRGWKLDLDLNRTGGILGGNRDFLKVDLGVSGYTRPVGKIVFAGRIKYGMIFGWDTTYQDIRYDQFYLGGSTSLRGWETLRFQTRQYREADGTRRTVPYGNIVRVLTNWEVRFPLVWLLGGEIFADGGQLTDHYARVSLNRIVWDVGAGLTLSTPLGPIRLDYAVPVRQTDQWQLHLGVHYIF
jgi:outer membrane protein insertion porin family